MDDEDNIRILVEGRRMKVAEHGRSVRIPQAREEEDDCGSSQAPSSTCSCKHCIKYLFFLVLLIFLIISPFLMLYVGVVYSYCDDMFSIWLILGAVLILGDAILFIFYKCDGRESEKNCVTLFLFGVLVILFIWWVWGFGRIFSGSMNDDPLLEDPECKQYLYDFPFWLSLLPFIFLFVGMFGFIAYNC